MFLNIGHRGSMYKAPENTLASFEMAVLEGANWLEMDLRKTKDGQIVIFHDATLNRTSNGRGRLALKTLKQLRELDLGSWFHPEFEDQKILTLEEVLQKFPAIGLNLEIKATGLETELARLLDKYSRQDVIVSCFLLGPLRKIKKIRPQTKLGVLAERRLGLKRKLNLALKFGFYSLHIEQSLLNEALTFDLESTGLKILPWSKTLYHEGRLRHLLALPIMGLINDFPASVAFHATRVIRLQKKPEKPKTFLGSLVKRQILRNPLSF